MDKNSKYAYDKVMDMIANGLPTFDTGIFNFLPVPPVIVMQKAVNDAVKMEDTLAETANATADTYVQSNIQDLEDKKQEVERKRLENLKLKKELGEPVPLETEKETPEKEAAEKETPEKETPEKEAAEKETPEKETPEKEAASISDKKKIGGNQTILFTKEECSFF